MSTEAHPHALAQLDTIQRALQEAATDPTAVARFSTTARAQAELLAALPPRYSEVLLNLLDRLESSALFSEESCSFSQKDLVANLTMWVEKAQATLTAR
jgi:hypothetical protein